MKHFTLSICALLLLVLALPAFSQSYVVSAPLQTLERHQRARTYSVGQLVYLDSNSLWQIASGSALSE